MGRKIKIAFSSSEKDSGFTYFHDFGFIARHKDGVEGFKVHLRNHKLENLIGKIKKKSKLKIKYQELDIYELT
jgi:sulfite reductase beta subunit-like hemoprotein